MIDEVNSEANLYTENSFNSSALYHQQNQLSSHEANDENAQKNNEIYYHHSNMPDLSPISGWYF